MLDALSLALRACITRLSSSGFLFTRVPDAWAAWARGAWRVVG
jgi:hypothetical protein